MPMYHLFEKKKTFCYIVGKKSKSTKNFLSKYLNVKKLFSFVYFTPPPPPKCLVAKKLGGGEGWRKRKENYFHFHLIIFRVNFYLILPFSF